jgi:hypothetical protein
MSGVRGFRVMKQKQPISAASLQIHDSYGTGRLFFTFSGATINLIIHSQADQHD